MCIHHNFPLSSTYALDVYSCFLRFLLAYMEISPCIHGDFSFSLVRFSFIPVSILCVDHTISWCTTHLDSNILVLVITFLGVVSIPFLNQFMDSNNLVLVFIFPWYIFISRSLATHRLPPFDRYRLIFLEIGVDFYISATDFLEIEIYYNKRKFSLFSL